MYCTCALRWRSFFWFWVVDQEFLVKPNWGFIGLVGLEVVDEVRLSFRVSTSARPRHPNQAAETWSIGSATTPKSTNESSRAPETRAWTCEPTAFAPAAHSAPAGFVRNTFEAYPQDRFSSIRYSCNLRREELREWSSLIGRLTLPTKSSSLAVPYIAGLCVQPLPKEISARRVIWICLKLCSFGTNLYSNSFCRYAHPASS